MKFRVFWNKYGLVVEWVLATLIGQMLSGLFVTTQVHVPIPVDFDLEILGISRTIFEAVLISEVIHGISLGMFQWLVLRSRVSQSARWIVVTPLGMIFGGYMSPLFLKVEHQLLLRGLGPIDVGLSMVLYGVTIGLSQWVVLRKSLSIAWTWVITNGLGWSLAITLGTDFIRRSLYGYPGFISYTLVNPYYEIVIHSSIGMFVGIITGLFLWWLLNQKNDTNQTAM